jgi:hypothetical protein
MQVLQHLPLGPFPRFGRQEPAMDAIIRNKFAPGISDSWTEMCSDETKATTALAAWNARVKALIPEDQLLVFETGKHGYKELCDFLGVALPAAEYPRSNSTAELQLIITAMWILATLLVVGGPAGAIYMLSKMIGPASKKKLETKID